MEIIYPNKGQMIINGWNVVNVEQHILWHVIVTKRNVFWLDVLNTNSKFLFPNFIAGFCLVKIGRKCYNFDFDLQAN